VPPIPVLVIGSALRSCPHVALSSAQAIDHRSADFQPWQARDQSASLPSCFSGHSPPLSGRFKLPVALSKNLLIPSSRLVRWSHITQRTVKPNFVIMPHVVLDQSLGVFQR
jgi:hypothetical protein